MKIIYHAPGQTCNRFWCYLDIVAEAIINKEHVVIYLWDDSMKYYDRFRKYNQYVFFPFYSSFLDKKIGHIRYQNFLVHAFINHFLWPFYNSRIGRKLGFVNSWPRRSSHDYYPALIDKMRDLFKPNPEICEKVSSLFLRYRSQDYFIIGVHIRRGDYRTFFSGMFFFEQEEYATIMRNLVSLYPEKKVAFFIASNEKIDIERFDGLTIIQGDSFKAPHDLEALSMCDRIIGPVSTFSRWASLMGHVPLCYISRESNIESDSDFSPVSDYFHFENGKEIINLEHLSKTFPGGNGCKLGVS